jgi:hypothetical protein
MTREAAGVRAGGLSSSVESAHSWTCSRISTGSTARIAAAALVASMVAESARREADTCAAYAVGDSLP